MEPTWVLSAPDGPHFDPMNLAIRDATHWYWRPPCWRQDIDTLSALLALYKVNHWSLVDFPHKGSVMRSFCVLSVARLKNLWNKEASCRWMETPWFPCNFIAITVCVKWAVLISIHTRFNFTLFTISIHTRFNFNFFIIYVNELEYHLLII